MKKETNKQAAAAAEAVNLTALLSHKAPFTRFNIWIIGDTPLIVHAWSTKAKMEMLQKQVKATKGGRAVRNPEEEYVSTLYEFSGGDVYGFPATGIKNCILSAAHKDKGIARTAVRSALWIDAEMIRVRPAMAGATCDMPLVRIYGDKPVMREDMVKVGSALNKVADLRYRAQFTVWAIKLTGRFNSAVITPDALAMVIQDSGLSSGLGEWRNERDGMFGAFHLATASEEKAWDDFAAGRGALPLPEYYRQAAE